MPNTNSSDWSPSVDIYNVVEMVDNVKKRFIEDEDETTLAVGIFGFITDTEAKKIQTAAIMTGELGNEMFPQRAKLDKNIVTHAIYCNVGELNAIPAVLTLNIAIKEDDLELYIQNNEFVFDHTCPIYVGDYEFHLDYDIVLHRYKRAGADKWVYNARYDMEEPNPISDITSPYLGQPFKQNYDNYEYIFFQAIVRQCTIETTEDVMVSASIIDNKSFVFTFENQLAQFEVFITENGTTTKLTPYMYGESLPPGEIDYCWYLYINDDTIRIGFDQKSYLPGLSADIRIVAYTTLGAAGNFDYKTTEEESGFYIGFESSTYSYKKINCLGSCATTSANGKDKKSIEELKQLIPKMAMSRGYITTETDLNSYFNLISDDNNRVALMKKTDNQLSRVWYCYLIIKDGDNNVVPTSTVPIRVDLNSSYILQCEGDDERYLIPCGTLFCYDPDLDYATIMKPDDVPEKYSDEYFSDNKFYYRSIYNIIINTDPIYAAYYLSIINRDSYFQYNFVNENLDVGFVTNTYHSERSLLSNQDEYRITFSITQSVQDNYGLYYILKDFETNVETVVNNLKVYLVLWKDGEPYRYAEATVTGFDETNYTIDYQVTLKTDNQYDSENCLKLLDLYEIGYTSKNYGYFTASCDAYIYIFGKFGEEYGKYNADLMMPDTKGYSLINIYQCHDGLTLFENYTNIMNSRVRKIVSENKKYTNYDISGVPLIGEHFFLNEENVKYFMDQLDTKKAYIDYCLRVLENNMDIDFKFFNTYGYSKTFNKTYTNGEVAIGPLGHVDLTMKWRLRLVNSSDTSTRQDIIAFIKDYIENINDSADEELHIPNLIHDLTAEFGGADNRMMWIEFLSFNDNELGINHIELKSDDELSSVHIPKEFINIRNRLNDIGELEPCIDIELIL